MRITEANQLSIAALIADLRATNEAQAQRIAKLEAFVRSVACDCDKCSGDRDLACRAREALGRTE